MRACPLACSVRRVDGETEAAVFARDEEDTSASCSWRSSWSWVSAKSGMDIGSGDMVGVEGV